MKKFICIVIAITSLFLCSSCSNQKKEEIQPELSQMKAICELATLECYYHNVAKFKETEKNLWWEETKHFWVEYEGIVKIGVDTSLITIDISEDDTVTISIPPAQVLGCNVDSKTLNKDSFIIDSKSKKITADDQTKAHEQAETKMLNAARSNKSLLLNAQQRAQDLLENYVINIGNCVGKQYKIVWVDLVSDESSAGQTSETVSN
jgi:hypothetical protein